ncbi:protein tyr-4 [Chrysochromulina tobinii]|uniref:Protein tyr-4 n=1 Tax=Chrysochromulina tobinii TaxID=1460289 RepID=A0A0M0JQD4_9EUKA|nr:protein tyr-4 [Chrysochromulina tobinii]|eukprot:KOO28497.1 protein tyr-4 [Chrysochromulina sp. CCMP291]
MMNIPIDDEDSGDPEAAARDGDGHAHIVEQAEAHRLRRFAMVPWRTHHCERIPQLAVHHSRDQLDDGACREAGRVPGGACGEARARVEPAFDELIVDGDEACGALWMWRVALVQQHRPHARIVTFFLLAIVGSSTLILRNSQPIVAASVESVGIAARQLSEDVATATIVQQAKPADVKAAAAHKSPEAIPPAGRAVSAAPAAPTPCRDKNDRCADWASAGECVKNAAYMEGRCPRSCNLCQPPDAEPNETASAQSAATDQALRLADESKQCPTWAASGECTRNQVYMAKSCARSCWLYGQAQANPAAGASPHDES